MKPTVLIFKSIPLELHGGEEDAVSESRLSAQTGSTSPPSIVHQRVLKLVWSPLPTYILLIDSLSSLILRVGPHSRPRPVPGTGRTKPQRGICCQGAIRECAIAALLQKAKGPWGSRRRDIQGLRQVRAGTEAET